MSNKDIKKSGRNIFLTKLTIVTIIVSLVAAATVIIERLREAEQNKLASESKITYSELSSGEPQPTIEPSSTGFSPDETELTLPPILKYSSMPSTTHTSSAIRQEYAELMDKFDNPDIVGYISIPGTSIEYPVVQSSDNSYYLTRDLNKQKNSSGWVFLDYENDITRDDPNTIIYGHNMNNDIMFHSLRYYRDEEFYKAHSQVIFNTLYEDRKYEVFAFIKTKTEFNYITVLFQDREKEFGAILRGIKKREMYDTGVEVTTDDRILILSTCTNGASDERYALCAKLIQ